MELKISIYQIAEILKSEGFVAASNPFEMALQGNIVLILVPTSAAADICARSYYKKLANTGMPFKASKRKIYFKNGGRLEIHTPFVDPGSFKGLDRKTTFYFLYRG